MTGFGRTGSLFAFQHFEGTERKNSERKIQSIILIPSCIYRNCRNLCILLCMYYDISIQEWTMLNHGKPTHWWSQKSANCFVHIDHSKAPWPYSKGCYSALQRSEAIWLRTSNKMHWGSPKWKILVIFYLFIYVFFLTHIFLGRFFASNTTFRRGQGTLLLNDLVPHLTTQIFFLDFFHIFFWAQFHQF